MNAPISSHNDRMPDWYDPFAELRQIPAAWDLSGLTESVARGPRSEATPNPPTPQPAQLPRLGVTLN